jgi:hypothetical protein
MENKNKLDELNELKLGDSSNMNVDEFTKINAIAYNNFYTQVKEVLKQNFSFTESEFVTHLIVNIEFLSTIGITKNNFNELNISDHSKNWIKLIFDLKNKVFNKKEIYLKAIKKIKSFEEENSNVQLDLNIIISVFYEYVLIKECLKWIKENEKNYDEVISEIRESIINSLKTASIYLDFDFEAISAKSAYVRLGQKNSIELPITPEIIEVLRKATEPYKELNETVFNGSISNKILVALANYIIQFDESYLLNFPFTRLMSAINDKSKISHSALMLFFHDLLLHFNHPSAITEVDEERFDRLNVDSTTYSLNQKKIRVSERILKF